MSDAVDGVFDSGSVSAGDAFEFAFDTPGMFGYACAIHPIMVLTIVVS